MKTFKVTSCLLLFVTWFQTSLAAVPTSFQPVIATPAEATNLVKAIRVDGSWIPVVDLPVIEITALKVNSTILGVVPGKKQLVYQANLPMVEITATSLTAGRIKTGCRNGESVIVADLPVIEVVASFPERKLIAASGNIPVVNLPEITIRPESKVLLATAVETSAGTISPLVNLPEITIQDTNKHTSGAPFLYSVNHRLGYFFVDQGRSMIEKMIRFFIF